MPRTAESQTLPWPDEVYFHPWVGRNYNLGCGPNQRRLLIIGESHYCTPDDDNHRLTIDCIEEITARAWTHRFYTAIAEMVKGQKKWEIDLAEFWETVAFYNFIQECLGGPKATVTETMLQDGRTALPRILEQLQPDCVLVLSGRAWDWWIDGWTESAPLLVAGSQRDCRVFNHGDNPTSFATWIYHPSSFGFGDAVQYHPIVHALLEH